MIDQGAVCTDKELAKMEKKIKQIYSEAQSDIEDKIAEFNKKFYAKQSVYQQKLKDGDITQEQYDQWLRGQVFQSKQWESKKDQIIGVIQNANKEAANILNGGTISVFAENANWSHYQMEQSQGVNFGFGLYDAQTVTNLIKNDPQVLPKWKVNEPKDYIWNSKKVNNSITQGIIQGEGLDKIAKRLANSLSSNNRNTMLTFARTAMTGAQNAGRYQSQQDAKELGIDIVKVWMSTLDKHTRVSHQELDGEEQKVGDKWHPFKFSNGCRYPGDPQGPPHEVYNCRCTLVSDIKDYPSKFNRYDNIDGKPIKNMTYTEWEAAKKKSKPSANTIINGKDISAAWKRRPDQFDFEIEDVINAQGFDGKPRVVSAEEFDEAVKKSNFVAQRTYSAPDQETLDAYRDQLYNGKWYVDCSTGGAQYGQGMYCAADYTGKITDGIKNEMSHYRDLGRSRNDSAAKELAFQKVWDDALQSANDEEKALIKREFLLNATDEERHLARAFEKRDEDAYDALVDKYAAIAQKAKSARESAEAKSYTETLTLDPSAKVITYKELMDIRIENLMLQHKFSDPGSLATALGYDAINAEGHGQSGSYTVILNRTKCIFKGE